MVRNVPMRLSVKNTHTTALNKTNIRSPSIILLQNRLYMPVEQSSIFVNLPLIPDEFFANTPLHAWGVKPLSHSHTLRSCSFVYDRVLTRSCLSRTFVEIAGFQPRENTLEKLSKETVRLSNESVLWTCKLSSAQFSGFPSRARTGTASIQSRKKRWTGRLTWPQGPMKRCFRTFLWTYRPALFRFT